ncbi:MAG: type II toxin-antitoxin system VapC family toxin [Burkholderiaceae bacterium]
MTRGEPVFAITDTHALIWAATGNVKRLGRRARRLFERADDGECAIYIPAIALVELGEACHRGVVTLNRPFGAWVKAAFDSGSYLPAPLTPEVVHAAQSLYGIPERADRLIAATAVVLDLPLITRDEQIARSASVECLWR